MGKRGRARARRQPVRRDDLSPAPDVAETITGEPDPTLTDPEEAAEDEAAPGLLVALTLDEATAAAIAVPGGEPAAALHLTLAYCPEDGTPDQGKRIARAVGQWAADTMPVWAAITGGAVFADDPDEPEAALVALVDSYSLLEVRASLCRHLTAAGIYPSEEHTFLPHITVAYRPVDSFADVPVPEPMDINFDYAAVAVGGKDTATVTHFALLGPDLVPDGTDPVMRSDEDRYTLAPLYSPGRDDTHGEWTDADTLQKAAWDYFRAGDRDVFLQHMPDIVAGEVVELVTWPFEQTVTLTKGGGAAETVVIPAGTVYEGVVWNPWAWEAVKDGKLNGLSLGGMAYRVPTA